MARSTRTPIDRQPRPTIDAEAVRMFRRGTKFVSEGREGDAEFRKIATLLHRKLGLRPWQPSVFDVSDDDPPAAPDHAFHWKLVVSLRRQLAELARPRLVRDEREAAATRRAEPPR